ncbi:MAG: hypothetical protein ISS16_03310 [Ignavibacteria bacterium]|nr:hypothetical protein [Ignavibacteria bacterium]
MNNELLISGGLILQMIVIYFLKDNILDLLLRFIQNLNKPLAFIINSMNGSKSSIIRLNFRQQLLNFFIVIVAIIMLIFEYGTLEKIISAASEEGSIMEFGLGVFSAVSYITITVVLGFIAMELIDVKKLFQNIFYNDIPVDEENKYRYVSKVNRSIIAGIIFIALLILAYYQGELALLRYETSVSVDFILKDSQKEIIQAFYFILGFLTPIVAALALISLDIFVAIIAKFIIFSLRIIQKGLAALYLALEIVITILASPIIKLLEFFGIFQFEKINSTNQDKVKPAIKLAPLRNNSKVFLRNIAQMINLYNMRESISNSLLFICVQPNIKEELPSLEQKIELNTTFQEIRNFLIKKYSVLQRLSFNFQYLNLSGEIVDIEESDLPINYIHIVNSIIININIRTQG